MEHYSNKKEELLRHVRIWMPLWGIVPSGKSRSLKLCAVWLHLQSILRELEMDSRSVVPRDEMAAGRVGV